MYPTQQLRYRRKEETESESDDSFSESSDDLYRGKNYIQRNNVLTKPAKTMQSNYNTVYSKEFNEQLSLRQEPEIQYETREHYINITSSARDTTNQALHYNYYIQLDKEKYKNVIKVEMLSAFFPNSANITDEPYLVFDIEELNCIDFFNGDKNNNGFAVLPIKPTTGAFIVPDFGCIYHTVYFPRPAKSLTRLTIKIRDINGNLYDFGSPNGSTSTALQNGFQLKITTEEVNRRILGERHTYN